MRRRWGTSSARRCCGSKRRGWPRAGPARSRRRRGRASPPWWTGCARALRIDEEAAREWRAALGPLLAFAAGGWWNPEGRFLYDLQKVCVDHEREVYSVSVVDWLLDWNNWRHGFRPLRKPLPRQRPVLVCKHLRSAAHRLPRLRLTASQRGRLSRLLHDAVHDAERRVREELRPPVVESLDAAGLCPHTAVERAARQKLVEELLDETVRRGFLGMGNLRDAVSRNQMKLHDLEGPAEFFSGDQLLRLNRRLAGSLAGVYRPGEAYLRFFQRFSSLLFATRFGRLLTRTVLIPFGGAFLILAGLEHTVGLLLHKLAGVPKEAIEELTRPHSIVGLGLFLFAVVNWPAFRAAAGWAGKVAARARGRSSSASRAGSSPGRWSGRR